MPLVQFNGLPSIDRVQSEGVSVCAENEIDLSLPMLNIGFLNMMPDAAVSATERQFLRLLGSNNNVNCFFFPFNIAGVNRTPELKSHIDNFYLDFDQIKAKQLDALVVTGANVSQPLLSNESFWDELIKVLDWAKENVISTICSCLATHAAVKVFYDIDRRHLGKKCWGVYPHEDVDQQHVLTSKVKPNISMCHSRFNDISADSFIDNDISILINSHEVGVQLAAEKDMSVVYFQGHPEYDDISLLKEYKREIINYLSGMRSDYPPVPQNYFDSASLSVADKYKQIVLDSDKHMDIISEFPEDALRRDVDSVWGESALSIFNSWLEYLVKKKNSAS